MDRIKRIGTKDAICAPLTPVAQGSKLMNRLSMFLPNEVS